LQVPSLDEPFRGLDAAEVSCLHLIRVIAVRRVIVVMTVSLPLFLLAGQLLHGLSVLLGHRGGGLLGRGAVIGGEEGGGQEGIEPLLHRGMGHSLVLSVLATTTTASHSHSISASIIIVIIGSHDSLFSLHHVCHPLLALHIYPTSTTISDSRLWLRRVRQGNEGSEGQCDGDGPVHSLPLPPPQRIGPAVCCHGAEGSVELTYSMSSQYR